MQKPKGSLLDAVVTRRLNKFTVIVTALQILEEHLRTCKLGKPPAGLSLREIARGYNLIADSVGKPGFFGSYVQRHAKSGDLFQEAGGRYRFRDEFVVSLKVPEIARLRIRIVSHHYCPANFSSMWNMALFYRAETISTVVIDLNVDRPDSAVAGALGSRDEFRTRLVRPDDRPSFHPRVPQMCRPLSRQSSRATLLLLGSVPLHGLRTIHLPRKLSATSSPAWGRSDRLAITWAFAAASRAAPWPTPTRRATGESSRTSPKR